MRFFSRHYLILRMEYQLQILGSIYLKLELNAKVAAKDLVSELSLLSKRMIELFFYMDSERMKEETLIKTT